MSEERLLSVLSKPKLIKNNFDNERLKRLEKISINQDINFLKSKVRDQKKSLQNRKQKKSFNTKNQRN